MPKTNAELKLEEANKKLSESLDSLETLMIEKLHETSLYSGMFNLGDDDTSLKAQVISQTGTIQNLNDEVNNLQKTISELSAENENLLEQNKSLLGKINKLRLESTDLMGELQEDLQHISNIIARGK